jgi:hypothetical protein
MLLHCRLESQVICLSSKSQPDLDMLWVNDPNISPLLNGLLNDDRYDEKFVLVKYTLLGDADFDGNTDF